MGKIRRIGTEETFASGQLSLDDHLTLQQCGVSRVQNRNVIRIVTQTDWCEPWRGKLYVTWQTDGWTEDTAKGHMSTIKTDSSLPALETIQAWYRNKGSPSNLFECKRMFCAGREVQSNVSFHEQGIHEEAVVRVSEVRTAGYHSHARAEVIHFQ